MCSSPRDVACAKEAHFLPRYSLGVEVGPSRGAIVGHLSEEELFLLSEVKLYCQYGQSQTFESEEIGYLKDEILQYINKHIYLYMVIFIMTYF